MKKLKSILDFILLKIVSPFNWERLTFLFTGKSYQLTAAQREYARRLMQHKAGLWVSRRRTHLTSYLISFADFALQLRTWVMSGFKGPRPKFSYWTHAFISTTDGTLIEAIGKGVFESYFDDVFDCDAVAYLVPSFLSLTEWSEVSERVVKKARELKGRPYDTVFNIADESAVSCIELMRIALKEVPHYEKHFADFEKMINLYKNVTPEMLYQSKSFVVAWEVRH